MADGMTAYDEAHQEVYLQKMQKSGQEVLAKISAMSDAEKVRDGRLEWAWLLASNNGDGRAEKIMREAETAGKTMTELTNGVMPDRSQI